MYNQEFSYSSIFQNLIVYVPHALYNIVMIEIKNLNFGYQPNRKALFELSLAIENGEVVTFFGEEGAGKTSFLSLVCGILKGYEGSLLIDGHERSDLGDRDVRISFLPKKTLGLTFGSVKKNLNFAISVWGEDLSKLEKKKKITEAMKIFGLTLSRNLPFFLLSRGKRFRLALARSFLKNPKILLIDEPQKSMRDVKEIARLLESFECTKIIASEDVEIARAFGKRVFCMSFGSLVGVGSMEELQKSPPTIFFARSFNLDFTEREMTLKFDADGCIMCDEVYSISCDIAYMSENFHFENGDEKRVVLFADDEKIIEGLSSSTLFPHASVYEFWFVFDAETGLRIF